MEALLIILGGVAGVVALGFVFLLIGGKKPYGPSSAAEYEKPEESEGDKNTPLAAIIEAAKRRREQWLVPFISLLGYAAVNLAIAWVLPKQAWDFWSSTSLFWGLFLFVPLFALAMTKGGWAGKFFAAVVIFFFVGTGGYDLITYIKEHSPKEEAPLQSTQTATSSQLTLRFWEQVLQSGETYEPPLRGDGSKLPLKSSFAGGCVEYVYNRQSPVIVCGLGHAPQIEPDGNAIKWPAGESYSFTKETGQEISSLVLRNLSNKPLIVSFKETSP